MIFELTSNPKLNTFKYKVDSEEFFAHKGEYIIFFEWIVYPREGEVIVLKHDEKSFKFYKKEGKIYGERI